jgi:hypothetical protein
MGKSVKKTAKAVFSFYEKNLRFFSGTSRLRTEGEKSGEVLTSSKPKIEVLFLAFTRKIYDFSQARAVFEPKVRKAVKC